MLRELGVFAISALPLVAAQASNGFESGWDQTAWPIYAPDCNQGGNVTLDSTVAHTGKNSIKVAGAGGYCGHVFFGTTAVPTGDIYTRTWLRASTNLTADHVSFMVMPDASLGTGKHLRFGGMEEIMIYNREDNDATLPDLSPQGVATSVGIPANTWQCVEQHLGKDGTIETWLNGDAIAGLTVKSGVANPNDSGWIRTPYTPSISGVYWGWESYGSAANTFWYDDVAVAATRVGCAVSGAANPAPVSSTTAGAKPTTTAKPTTLTTTTVAKPPATTSAAPAPAPTCTAAKYAQCGGIGFTGCTSCASGTTCQVNGPYYSQCL